MQVGEAGHLMRMDDDGRRGGYACLVEQPLGDVLVDGRGRTEDTAAGERDAGDLGQPLHGPVLAMRAVQHRKQDIDGRQFARAAIAVQRHDAPTPARKQAEPRALLRSRQVAALQPAQQPDPVARDEDGQHVVSFGIERAHRIGRRHDRDVVLGRAAAEQDGNAQPRTVGAFRHPVPLPPALRLPPAPP